MHCKKVEITRGITCMHWRYQPEASREGMVVSGCRGCRGLPITTRRYYRICNLNREPREVQVLPRDTAGEANRCECVKRGADCDHPGVSSYTTLAPGDVPANQPLRSNGPHRASERASACLRSAGVATVVGGSMQERGVGVTQGAVEQCAAEGLTKRLRAEAPWSPAVEGPRPLQAGVNAAA